MMAIPTQLHTLAGKWHGTNQLWLEPNEPVRESVGTAVFKLTAQGKFATLEYTWADEGQPQSGLLLFGSDGQQINATWVDYWHMQDAMLSCIGAAEPDGAIWVRGNYAAPPGPDWGWKIAIQPQTNNKFLFIMHNISPEGEEMLAVEVVFTRQEQ